MTGMKIATVVVNTKTHDYEYQDEVYGHAVYAALDKVLAKHPDWTSACAVFLPVRKED